MFRQGIAIGTDPVALDRSAASPGCPGQRFRLSSDILAGAGLIQGPNPRSTRLQAVSFTSCRRQVPVCGRDRGGELTYAIARVELAGTAPSSRSRDGERDLSLEARRSIPPHRPSPNIAPSWNVAPTDPLPIVRYGAKAGERSLDVMRWGLAPSWVNDIKVGFSNINAKAEGTASKPAFREAFQRRCLGKQPCAIALADRGLMALAGLWETCRSPSGERVRSFAVTTATPNELCAELHNQMPVVLKSNNRCGSVRIRRTRISSQGPARTVSVRRNDVLAGKRPGRQRQEQ
jgi:hypothetical protein